MGLILVGLLFGTNILAANERQGVYSVDVDVGPKWMQWQEFDASGGRLLQETGYLSHVGVLIDTRPETLDQRLHFSFYVDLYAGIVDYDGQDQQGNAVRSNTHYIGWEGIVIGDYRIGVINADNEISLVGGFGVDSWFRTIDSGINARGEAVSGLLEQYTIQYAHMGIGLRQPRFSSSLRLGIKMPLNISEVAELSDIGFSDDAHLSPHKKGAVYIDYKQTFAGDDYAWANGLFIKVSYESFRLLASDPRIVRDSGGLPVAVWQPRSDLDRIGVSIGQRF